MNAEISELNHNLDELNRRLEQRVEEKTADLMAAHQELTAQYAELVQSQEALQQNAQMQTVLREIAEYAISAPSLIALYEKVHRLIEQVLPAKNFYISLLDEAGSQLVVPYCVDETHTIPLQRPVRKGLTDYVMRLRKPLQVTPEALQKLRESGEVEVRLIHYRQWAGAPLMDASGKAFGAIAIFLVGDQERLLRPEDMDSLSIIAAHVSLAIERKQAQEKLVESELRYRTVLEQAPEAVILCDPETFEILEANSRFTSLFGYDLRLDAPVSLFDFIADSRQNIEVLFQTLNRSGFLPVQRRILRCKNGTLVTVERSATLIRLPNRNLILQTLRDVSVAVRREQEEHEKAIRDELTGLYNRRGFAEIVSEQLVQGATGALLLIDIDDFKLINDVYGHAIGDEYLAAFAGYLRETFGESAVIGRFGGDEFVLFFAGQDGLAAAIRSGEQMEVICLETESGTFFVQLSGGISLLQEPEANFDLQLQRAYLALHHAKNSGKWCCKLFDPTLQEQFNRRYAIKEALGGALAQNEFYLEYQPIFDIRQPVRSIVGFEALLRWKSSRLGAVAPSEFIPIAEDVSQILPIGKWALREACRFAVRLERRRGQLISISVNISMRQLAMPNFVEMVRETLRETGLPANRLSLEITESILMTDAATRIGYLEALRDQGITIALDDFGTGYSSYTYLAQMPITTLKIDKSTVSQITGSPNDKPMLLLESLLHMAALLGYRVVAEGVETEAQLAFLKSKGCGYCQGYLLGRPMTATKIFAQDAAPGGKST